jgi:hypothetical protein
MSPQCYPSAFVALCTHRSASEACNATTQAYTRLKTLEMFALCYLICRIEFYSNFYFCKELFTLYFIGELIFTQTAKNNLFLK